MSREFYNLCYDQYKLEMLETDQIYQRISFIPIVLSVLGAITFKLGRLDILNQVLTRIDVFIYYLANVASYILIGTSVIFAILYALPRKGQYKTLASMKAWQDWRQKYQKYLDSLGDEKLDEKADEAMIREICPKLAEAQANNAPINERRRQYFYKSVLTASLCMIPVSVEAFFCLLLKIRGL